MAKNSFAEFIKTHRKQSFKSARSFYREASKKNDISCSYTYYVSIENGDKMPSPEYSIQIIRALGIDMKQGLFEWARAQMPDKESKEIFKDVDYAKDISGGEISESENKVRVNRRQAKLLAKKVLCYEIMNLLACYHGVKVFTKKDLKKELNIPQKEISRALSYLHNESLIDFDGEVVQRTCEWFFVPKSEEYDSFRNTNLMRSVDNFKASSNSKYKNTTVRMATPELVNIIERKANDFRNWILELQLSPEEEKSAEPYFFSLFGTYRTFDFQKLGDLGHEYKI